MYPTHYTLSQKYPHSEFLQIAIHFPNIHPEEENSVLQLPAWRPGRYQLGNFAKNMRNLKATDQSGNFISHLKTGRESWSVNTKGLESFTLHYEVFTSVIDGGSTYVDEELWYINFINCLLFQPEAIDAACEITLKIPSDWTIATSLDKSESTLRAQSFYELVDSPLIAGKKLKELSYQLMGTTFHLWFHGNMQIQDEQKLVNDFKSFTEEQLETMGEFETDHYHFLYIFLDHKAYHGVEHLSSTCIVLGPSAEFQTATLYDNFLGISSHELFHYWNIIRIRPKEMYPYNFTKENYFTTGFVAEGVTTYYGDLFLVRSGVKDLDWYIKELNNLFKRHFQNYGRNHYSVADSSLDLWVDGYEVGTPNRKVSIYVKGAIIALILDLMIISNTEADRNLDDLMRLLWKDFYKKGIGYGEDDYLNAAEEIGGLDLTEYKNNFIHGKLEVEDQLSQQLINVGLKLTEKPNDNFMNRYVGLQTIAIADPETAVQVMAIAPGSLGEKHFRAGDTIISINQKPVSSISNELWLEGGELVFTFWRNGQLRESQVTIDKAANYYKTYAIELMDKMTEVQKRNRKKWLKK